MKKQVLLFMFLCADCFAQNATLVKDIAPGAASSFSDLYHGIVGHIGDKLLLNVKIGNIDKVYVTEGTPATTHELQTGSSDQQGFAYFVKTNDNRIAYAMVDFTNQTSTYKLYITDGITVKLMDKHNSSKVVNNLKVYGDYLYYISTHELRRIDLANTKDELVYSESEDLHDFYLESDFNTLYYIRGGGGKDTLFVANVTSSNKTNLGGVGQLFIANVKFTKVGNRLVFGAYQNPTSEGIRIYSTDGTLEGTVLLAFAEEGDFVPVVHDSKLYVMAFFDHAGFVTDGTIEGTTDFQEFSPVGFIEFNGELYLVSILSGFSNGYVLLNTDGTQVGGDQNENGYVYYVYDYFYKEEPISAILDGKLYTAGSYVKTGAEDQVGLEIMEIKPDPALPVYQRYTFYETKPGTESLYERDLYATDSKLFFIGNESSTGSELYVLNTSTPTLLSVKESEQKESLGFYPNPVSDILHLSYTGTDPILSIRLRDLSGQVVGTYEPSEDLDVSAVKSGMYFLEIQWQETTSVLKVMKK